MNPGDLARVTGDYYMWCGSSPNEVSTSIIAHLFPGEIVTVISDVPTRLGYNPSHYILCLAQNKLGYIYHSCLELVT